MIDGRTSGMDSRPGLLSDEAMPLTRALNRRQLLTHATLATAAFVLGPVDGLGLLERQGVAGLAFSPLLERFSTGELFGGPRGQ